MNIIYMLMMIPLVLAIFSLVWRNNPALSLLALAFFFTGTILYLGNNAALGLFQLSRQYSIAGEEEKAVLASAGQVLLSRGEDFSAGSFLGMILPQIAEFCFAFLMINTRIFNKISLAAGIIGFSLLILFTIWATFIPYYYNKVMMVGSLGGLFVLIWFVMIGIRLIIKAGEKNLFS